MAETDPKTRVLLHADHEAARARAIIIYTHAFQVTREAALLVVQTMSTQTKIGGTSGPRADSAYVPSAEDQRLVAAAFRAAAVELEESATVTSVFEAATAALALADQSS